MSESSVIHLASIANLSYRLSAEIIAKSSRNHQRFAAQDLKDAINNAAALINGLCDGPGPTLEERREAARAKEAYRATSTPVPGRADCVRQSKSQTKGQRQDVRPMGNRTH